MYSAPGLQRFFRFADAKLNWRDLRMRLGHPPEGSSTAAQEELDLNRDATLQPARSEGGTLRKE